ncbi:prolipoprotein diacylglyceryl transferase [Desulfonatronovibrio magnus]|uniref:prolipoprotein diacylglyceryl transferase n=1 Tax=Desulfonatronovibrio magnus TaxID=698827 RepID=UPI0005EBB9DB|nr:prolipoprotein diacylglyceryl transferase [Desulfonatronovibrio magnus]
MHPVLIEFGHFAFYSYGFFVSAAFLLGMAWTMREAEIRGLDHRLVLDAGFYVILGGILCSRLVFVAANFEMYSDDLLDILRLWKGGVVFMGGAVSSALMLIVFLHYKKQPVAKWLDAAAPGAALGIGVGWLGCLASGCAYGKPTDLFWSITYTHPDAVGPLFVAMHPVQAYQALAAFLCFIFLVLVRNKIAEPGRFAGLFLTIYVPLRMAMDLFRGDLQPELGIISINQVLGIAVFVTGVVLLKRSVSSS